MLGKCVLWKSTSIKAISNIFWQSLKVPKTESYTAVALAEAAADSCCAICSTKIQVVGNNVKQVQYTAILFLACFLIRRKKSEVAIFIEKISQGKWLFSPSHHLCCFIPKEEFSVDSSCFTLSWCPKTFIW